MSSPAAYQALDVLIEHALRELCAEARIVTLSAVDLARASVADPVLLHIASYQFRLAGLLCLEDTPAMRSGLASVLQRPAPFEGAAFADGCGELSNRICGAINRGLAQVFLHVGMSTPLFLSSHCLAHLDLLQADYVSGREVRLGNEACFRFLVCLSLTRGGTFDFHFNPDSQKSAGGELELF
jgi:hypothetical protein